MHILKWPELDIFDLFKERGLDTLRLNRIKNNIVHYANIMLKENLTEALREGSRGSNHDKSGLIFRKSFPRTIR